MMGNDFWDSVYHLMLTISVSANIYSIYRLEKRITAMDYSVQLLQASSHERLIKSWREVNLGEKHD